MKNFLTGDCQTGFSFGFCATSGFAAEIDDSVISVVMDSVELQSGDDFTEESIKAKKPTNVYTMCTK